MENNNQKVEDLNLTDNSTESTSTDNHPVTDKPEIRRVRIPVGQSTQAEACSTEPLADQADERPSDASGKSKTDIDTGLPAIKRIKLNGIDSVKSGLGSDESELIDDFEILQDADSEPPADQTQIRVPTAGSGSNRKKLNDQTIVERDSIRTDMSSLKQYLKKEPVGTAQTQDLKPWEIDQQYGAKLYRLSGYTTINKINRKFQAERQQRFLRQLLVTLIVVVFVILFVAILNPFKNITELKRILGINSMYGQSEQTGNLTPINTIQPSENVSGENNTSENGTPVNP